MKILVLINFMGCEASSDFQVVAFVGSVRKNSNNRGLLDFLKHSEQFKTLKIHVSTPDLAKIPFFNEDLQKQKRIPQSVIDLRKLVQKAHLLIFVTPQYNGSVAPALKNAYDWCSRPFDGKTSPVQLKCGGVLSTSWLAQTQIKDIQYMTQYWKLKIFQKSYYLNLGSKAFNEKGELTSKQQQERLIKWTQQLIVFAQKNQ